MTTTPSKPTIKFDTMYIERDENNSADEVHLFIERPDKDADAMCLLGISTLGKSTIIEISESLKTNGTSSAMWEDVDSIYSIGVKEKKVVFQIDTKYEGDTFTMKMEFPKASCIGLFDIILTCLTREEPDDRL